MHNERGFEFDLRKSRLNKIKHGLDFHEAQLIWEGPNIEYVARDFREKRKAIIGQINKKLYTCVFTMRGDKIRIISCRRSRREEGALYEEEKENT